MLDRRRDGLLGGAAVPLRRARLSLAAAVGVAALAGAAIALIHAFLVITLRASQIVSGLAITIFAGAAGLSSYLANDLNLANRPGAAPVPGRSSRRACRTGRSSARSCSARTRSSTSSWLCVVAVWFYLSRTRPGLNARAVGEAPGAADAMGIDVDRVPLRAHARRRRVRRRRRRDVHARDHAAVGRRDHRRRRLDRDRARDLRVLAAGALPRRRVLLRRAAGALAAAPGARHPPRADGALDELAAVRDDDRRARARCRRAARDGGSARRRPSASPYVREER